MISYLQTKFTIPYFLGPIHDPVLSPKLDTCFKQKKHVELHGKNLIELKRHVLNWQQSLNKPLIWLRLDALDSDPGRFWTVLVYGLRKHYPTLGQSLLNGIMDFHASPNPLVFDQFKSELTGKPFVLVFTGCRHIQRGIVNKQLMDLFETIRFDSTLIFLNDADTALFKADTQNLVRISVGDGLVNPSVPLPLPLPTYSNFLSILDTWWVRWLKHSEILLDNDLIQYAETNGEINFLNADLIMPTEEIRYQLRDLSRPIDYDWMALQIREMAYWLVDQGEWLEAFRWFLFNKDFEKAGDLLESHSINWLAEGGDPLTLLFWLRELPSVLLTARPLPAYLAAKVTFLLGLKNQSKFYITSVQNNLEAMARFSRSAQDLADIQITNGGLTYKKMVTMVNDLQGNIEESDEI